MENMAFVTFVEVLDVHLCGYNVIIFLKIQWVF